MSRMAIVLAKHVFHQLDGRQSLILNQMDSALISVCCSSEFQFLVSHGCPLNLSSLYSSTSKDNSWSKDIHWMELSGSLQTFKINMLVFKFLFLELSRILIASIL